MLGLKYRRQFSSREIEPFGIVETFDFPLRLGIMIKIEQPCDNVPFQVLIRVLERNVK